MITGGFVLGEVLFLFGVVRNTGLLAAVLSLIPGVIWVILYKPAGRGSRKLLPALFWVYLLLTAGSIMAGHLRMQYEIKQTNDELALALTGKYIAAEGTVIERSATSRQQILLLKDCIVRQGSSEYDLRRLRVELDPEMSCPALGNHVHVSGRTTAFEPATNPGQFDYQRYYRAAKLTYRISAGAVEITDPCIDRLADWLSRIQERGSEILYQVAGADAGLYQAMVLGDKTDLDPQLQSLYQRGGISHLFAISGLHMSLIGMGIYQLLRKAGAGFSLAGLLGAVLVFAYVIMIGPSPSVVRALVMLLAAFLAACLGRTYDLLSALSLAILVILWDSPWQLVQAGFQLSVGAILGIGILAPRLERICPGAGTKQPIISGLRASIVASLAIQMATMPALLYHFFQFPLYGILLNPIVIPLMGIVVVSGIAAILLGAVMPAAGVFAAGAGHYVLQYYEWICQLFLQLPGSTQVWGRPRLWQVAMYYMILVILLWLSDKAKQKWWVVIMLTTAILLRPLPVRGLRVTFLDVGQGDGIVLQNRGFAILVDGGSSDIKNLGRYRLEPFLKSSGITVIDYAYVTHADTDHISGLVYLLESAPDIKVKNLMLPILGKDDDAYQPLVELMSEQGGTVSWIAQGDAVAADDFQISCLYPGTHDPAPDRNAQSLVLKVTLGRFGMLLTGDMGAEQEQIMLKRAAVKTQLDDIVVLKVAHHGSRLSSSDEWLAVVKPAWSVVSYGAGNSYGHPHQDVRERLGAQSITLYETAKSGAIRLETDGYTISWQHFTDGY